MGKVYFLHNIFLLLVLLFYRAKEVLTQNKANIIIIFVKIRTYSWGVAIFLESCYTIIVKKITKKVKKMTRLASGHNNQFSTINKGFSGH